MKTIRLLIIGLILFLGGVVHAQFSMSVNFGTPPPWGPTGYTTVQYYYLPDVEAYYDVRSSMFIYFGGGTWIHRAYLPTRYKNYDLYGGYKVVMNDYHGNTPYTHFKEHKMKYAKGYRGKMQKTIGERPGRGKMNPKNTDRNPYGNREGNHEKGKNKGYGNDKGSSQGHDRGNSRDRDRNIKKDHGHNEGNGKKR
jgi:hypothetical protein